MAVSSLVLAVVICGCGILVGSEAQDPPDELSGSFPLERLGAEVQKQYSGSGISMVPTESGARLSAIIQDLSGEVTPEGLWLTSTANEDGGQATAFRVRSIAAGKTNDISMIQAFTAPLTGNVQVGQDTASWIRPGIVEEYSVSTDGVRQDFIVPSRPEGTGDLTLALEITGATATRARYGARLQLEGSGRELAYHRLTVNDATGRELPAQMIVTHARQLAIRVEDTDAVYPVRIDPTFSDADWVSLNPGLPGTNGTVRALAVDNEGNLYIGGTFTVVDTILAHNIAKWDGSSWSSLDSGTNAEVRALAAIGTDLYAGGTFTTVGGVAAFKIAKWDGLSWSPMDPIMNGAVYALATDGNDLYAGGSFTTAGGVTINRIGKWNGSAWSALGGGTNGIVYALALSGTDLYAGGTFTTADGAAASRIAKWDGVAWSTLGSGVTDAVHSLVVDGSEVYVGGRFTVAGGIPCNRIAKWNGSVWSSLGSGVDNIIDVLTLSGGNLYAGGSFATAGGVAAGRIAKWDGASWSALGPALTGYVYALQIVGSDLYAGGDTRLSGGAVGTDIVKWNGSTWSGFGTEAMNGGVTALAVRGSDVYVGGGFTVAGEIVANRIAKWDGSEWSPLGSGTDGTVNALAFMGTDLYAGGEFTIAGGLAANRIAKWDGTTWSALGSGLDNTVHALAVIDGDLFVGGTFATAGGVSAYRLAKWNGSAWSAMAPSPPSGFTGSVQAMAVSGSDLYVGGFFGAIGTTPAAGIAKWDGQDWSALGTGLNQIVTAITVVGDCVYAGGRFSSAGGVPASRVAKWNGVEWSALGAGLNGTVNALASSGRFIYAGGDFTTSGGLGVNHIARWDGVEWSPLGSGANAGVQALALSNDELYVGGYFTIVGTKVSPYIAKATLTETSSEIAISGNGIGIAYCDTTPDSHDHTHFGHTSIFGTTRLHTFTISNLGVADLTLTGDSSQHVTLSGSGAAAFQVTTQPAFETIPSGGTATFTIAFNPLTKGTHSATVSIHNDDSDENPFLFQIRGSAGTALSQSFYPPSVGPQYGAQLGYSVAADGNYLVAGAPYDDTGGYNLGVVKVFHAGSGQLIHVIPNPANTSNSRFGSAVSLSGSWLAVGSPRDRTGSISAGSVSIFDLASETPTSPLFTLNSPAPESDGYFGYSVAISGSRVVVGAYREDSGATDSGTAYVFELTSATPTLPLYTLNNPEPAANDQFGNAVAISGTRVVVGAALNGDNNFGAAYVYELTSESPTIPMYTLDNIGYGFGAEFGSSVGIHGSLLVVGAQKDSRKELSAGAAFVFDLESETPLAPALTLYHSFPHNADRFGNSVAIRGTKVAVGAYQDNTYTFNAGGTLIFDLTSATPDQAVAYLTSPWGNEDNEFGCSVALSETHLLVGARRDDNGAEDAGSALAYDLSTGIPTVPTFLLNHPGPRPGESFGRSVAVSGSRMAVGAYGDDTGSTDAGAVYVYDLRSASPTSPSLTLYNPDPGTLDNFGWAVGISGSKLITGSSGNDTGATASGSAYIFDLNSPTPSVPFISLYNPDPGLSDRFGFAVAIDGALAVVGADFDDTGAANAGSAYVYDLSQGTPTVPVAVLNNPDPDPLDFFGRDVAISGTWIVVAAASDDTGAPNAGSVYVYDLTSTTPTMPSIILNNPDPAQSEYFGNSVAISGNRVVIGCFGDAHPATTGAGRAYIYDLNSATPEVPELVLDNPTPAEFDYFGHSVAVSGATVVVGAIQDDTDGNNAGIAYVFDLTTPDPTRAVAILHNPAPADGDRFGYSAAVDGTTIAIGVKDDGSVGEARGAAYVFSPGGTSAEQFTSLLSATGLTGDAASAEATPHHDGVANLLKYAFNMNLSGPDVRIQIPSGQAGGLPSMGYTPHSPAELGSIMRLEFVRRIGSGLTYLPQKSFNLGPSSWMPLSDTPTVIPLDPEWERVIYEEPIDPALTPACFGRVRVTLP